MEFISYESCDSYQIHKDKDIAVVPTTGSEGTSLSLLEAMASNCACICTDIGGMTNIVLNNFNGLIVPASDSQELLSALLRLVDDKYLRTEIAANGLNTVASSFSFELWKERWTAVLSKYASESP